MAVEGTLPYSQESVC